MSVWCGAWSDMSDKSDLSDIIGAPPTRARGLALDKFVFAIEVFFFPILCTGLTKSS